MIVLFFSSCFSIFQFIDPSDPKINYSYSLPSFSSWYIPSGISIDGNVVIVPPNKKASDSIRISININNIDSEKYQNIYHFCPTDSTPIPGARCYLDITEGSSPIQWGANSNLGYASNWILSKPISNLTTFSFYLENKNLTFSARFLLPQLTPYINKIQNFPENRIIKENLKQNINKFKLIMNVLNEEIIILSEKLINSHKLPSMISFENDYFSVLTGRKNPEFTPLVILANKTHIIGIDIYSTSFWHVWKSNQMSYFSLNLKTRKEFELSLIVIEKDTNSYLEAIEFWHNSFRDKYLPQDNFHSGMWVPFADLNDCFPNNTDDKDIFMAQNRWGGSTSSPKKYLPQFKYYEILVEHSTIPYDENYDLTIKNCSDKGDTQCKRIWNTASRDSNGKIDARSENEDWNVGSYVRVNFAGIKYEEALNDSINSNIINVYNGTGSDSFTITSIDYLTDDHEPDDCLPYYLVDEFDHKYFVPLMANHFKFFNLFKNKMNGGIMTNSYLNIPQLVENIRSAGFEIALINPFTKYINYYRTCFWLQRFQVGSHTMSMLENSDRTNSFQYAEEEFSIQLSFGSFPSYFSHNAASNNFWNNCNDLNLMKSHFSKWKNVLTTTLIDTEFFANCKGIVHHYLPDDDQIPSLNDENEINDYSMFCEKESKAINNKINCYVNILIGYRGTNVIQSTFKRTVIYHFDQKPELFFKSDNLDINIDSNNNITIILSNVSVYHTYRAASFKVIYELNNNNNNQNNSNIIYYYIGGILLFLIGIIGIFIISNKFNNNKNDFPSLSI